MDSSTAQLSILLLTGIIVMLLLAVALILFFVVYQRRLLTQQETMTQREADYQKTLLTSTIQAQEIERRRIARDLHDGVGGLLSATKLYVNQLSARESGPGIDVKQEAVQLIDETIDNIRLITRNLLPASLERLGFVAAAEDLCRIVGDSGQLTVDFQYNEAPRFDAQHEVALFRILQELTNNTLKHAQATRISIQLAFAFNHLTLIYRDNGCGFDLAEWQKDSHPKSLGLKSIESRASLLRAQIGYESSPGEGFCARLTTEIKI